MKKELIFLLFGLFAVSLNNIGCQSNGVGDIYVSKNVLKTADWAEFRYNDYLKASLQGDITAIKNMLDFMSALDGADRIEHAQTIYELIGKVGDHKVASACGLVKPKLKPIIMENLLYAPKRTSVEALKGKEVSAVAPLTWNALTNGVVPPSDDVKTSGTIEVMKETNPDGSPKVDMEMSKIPPQPSTKPATEPSKPMPKKEGGN